MALDTLSKSALEALLAFHLDAVGQIRQMLQAKNPVACSLHVDKYITEVSDPEPPLQSPFCLRAQDDSSGVLLPSPPSTPRRQRAPRHPSSPPSLRPTDSPVWQRGGRSESPSPLRKTRKRRYVELYDELDTNHSLGIDDRPPARVPRRDSRKRSRSTSPVWPVPGWPRGFIPIPKRRKGHVANKENERD
ncbi:hypothetical protein MIND_01224400 [Mycena indigotica]|uniref:Uncharacterized protein n=1 Tax=Mycena indigotica TaxID=2126181 RepID=A0A8H6S548_9AGAR|nr:uncharacterized protein MIND_01224400 [Mycena indigotica]KAF7291987.1 hypothetical protein MIND_01224400 [Mycena indigotica]